MVYFYWQFYVFSVFLSSLSAVRSALYPTQPVANTVFFCGDSALVTWIDTRQHPRVAALGPLAIKLYTNDDNYVTTLAQGVNPVSYGTLVTIPLDLRNDTLYLLRFSGPGLPEDVWTADFTILSESSSLGSSLRPTSLLATSSAIGQTPVHSLLQPTSTVSSVKQIDTDISPAPTVIADPLDSYSSPPRKNGALYSRADQLDRARFRLLFFVWPAMFGLSMAL